jgi:hypothetical protein
MVPESLLPEEHDSKFANPNPEEMEGLAQSPRVDP